MSFPRADMPTAWWWWSMERKWLLLRKRGKEKHSAMRNVAGEVLGAMKAMTYAKEQGYQKLTLYFDYQGIESWALGTWKRNNTLTQEYH